MNDDFRAMAALGAEVGDALTADPRLKLRWRSAIFAATPPPIRIRLGTEMRFSGSAIGAKEVPEVDLCISSGVGSDCKGEGDLRLVVGL